MTSLTPNKNATGDSVRTLSLTDVLTVIGDHWLRFILIGLVVVSAINAVAVIRAPDEPLYKSEALVVASELEIRVDSLPRTASAIFNAGTVAVEAARIAGTGISPDDLIPQIVTVDPVENTGVIEIDAVHPDPELAALYANAAGTALASELNKIGPGLGVFQLQISATPARDPEPVSYLPYVVLSLVAAFSVTLGLATIEAFLGSVQITDDQPEVAAFDRPAPPRLVSPASAPRQPSEPEHLDRPNVAREHARVVEAEPTRINDDEGADDMQPQLPRLVQPLEKLSRPAPIHPLATSYEQAEELIQSITGVGPVYGGRLAALGIRRPAQLAAADPKWVSEAVEVPKEVVIDWIRQAVGLTSTQTKPAEEE